MKKKFIVLSVAIILALSLTGAQCVALFAYLVLDMQPVSDQVAYAQTTSVLWKTSDAGANWSVVGDGGQAITGDSTRMYQLLSGGTILVSYNGGVAGTWMSYTYLSGIEDILYNPVSEILYARDNTGVLFTDTSVTPSMAEDWTELSVTAMTAGSSSLMILSGNDIYLTVNNGLYKQTSGTGEFVLVDDTTATNSIKSLAVQGSNIVMIEEGSGDVDSEILYRSTDGGSIFTQVNDDSLLGMDMVAFAPGGVVYVSVDSSMVACTDITAATPSWTTLGTGLNTTQNLNMIGVLSDNNIVVTNIQGETSDSTRRLFYTNNAGTSWNESVCEEASSE